MSEATIHTHEQDGRRHPGHKPKLGDEVEPWTIYVCKNAFGEIVRLYPAQVISFKLGGDRTTDATITVTPLDGGPDLFTSSEVISVTNLRPAVRTISPGAELHEYRISTQPERAGFEEPIQGTIRVGSGTGQGD